MSETPSVRVHGIKYLMPFLDLIPISTAHNEAIGDRIAADGKIHIPVITWKEKRTKSSETVVDGCHRVMHAKEHDLPIPIMRKSFKSVEEAREFCLSVNCDRRHLTDAELSDQRAKRIARVAEARQEGDSLRTIADREKISEAQVRRDLEASTAPGGGAVEPAGGIVHGADGKDRPLQAKPAPIFCETCTRRGPRRNCTECEKLRSKGPAKSKKKPAKAGAAKFDFRKFHSQFTPIAQAASAIAKAYPGENKSPEFISCEESLNNYIETFSRWQKRLTGKGE